MANTELDQSEHIEAPEFVTFQERRRRRFGRPNRNHVLVTSHSLEATGRDVEDLALAELRLSIV